MKKYFTQNSLAGICCLGAGLWDLYNSKALNSMNIMAFGAGWGLIRSSEISSFKI